MPLYDSVNGVARKVVRMYDSVDGVARQITKGYTCVNGVARPYYTGNIPLCELPIGTEIYTNVAGDKTAFIVIHQGKPDSEFYDSSCEGTWLLSKYVYNNPIRIASDEFANRNNSNISYADLLLDYYLNNKVVNPIGEPVATFTSDLDPNVREVIKSVNIPYETYDFRYSPHPETGELVKSVGMNIGYLQTNIFLLSSPEVGIYTGIRRWGCLSYFDTSNVAYQTVSQRRVGFRKSTAGVFDGYHWGLRDLGVSSALDEVIEDGDNLYIDCWCAVSGSDYIYPKLQNGSTYVRPAFILPSDVKVDRNFNIIP